MHANTTTTTLGRPMETTMNSAGHSRSFFPRGSQQRRQIKHKLPKANGTYTDRDNVT
jgi:hypothetical protein